jgi:hypothetical protein
MRQKLVLERAHFNDHLGVEEADEIELIEDKLDDEAPWELAFEQGVQLADDEMINSWDDEDEFE